MSLKKLTSVAVMKLIEIQNTASIAPTLGTKVMVISCTEVSACNRPMALPTARAMARNFFFQSGGSKISGKLIS